MSSSNAQASRTETSSQSGGTLSSHLRQHKSSVSLVLKSKGSRCEIQMLQAAPLEVKSSAVLAAESQESAESIPVLQPSSFYVDEGVEGDTRRQAGSSQLT